MIPMHMGKKKYFGAPPVYDALDVLFIQASRTMKSSFDQNRFLCCQKIYRRPRKARNKENILHLSCFIENQKKPPERSGT